MKTFLRFYFVLSCLFFSSLTIQASEPTPEQNAFDQLYATSWAQRLVTLKSCADLKTIPPQNSDQKLFLQDVNSQHLDKVKYPEFDYSGTELRFHASGSKIPAVTFNFKEFHNGRLLVNGLIVDLKHLSYTHAKVNIHDIMTRGKKSKSLWKALLPDANAETDEDKIQKAYEDTYAAKMAEMGADVEYMKLPTTGDLPSAILAVYHKSINQYGEPGQNIILTRFICANGDLKVVRSSLQMADGKPGPWDQNQAFQYLEKTGKKEGYYWGRCTTPPDLPDQRFMEFQADEKGVVNGIDTFEKGQKNGAGHRNLCKERRKYFSDQQPDRHALGRPASHRSKTAGTTKTCLWFLSASRRSLLQANGLRKKRSMRVFRKCSSNTAKKDRLIYPQASINSGAFST